MNYASIASRLIPHHVQRSFTSSSGAESPLKLNMAAAASTALAIGSVAWYYHLYGPTAHAAPMAEEG
jgi:ubiquinol-cytochrome c reductase cytochrome c1 subunit